MKIKNSWNRIVSLFFSEQKLSTLKQVREQREWVSSYTISISPLHSSIMYRHIPTISPHDCALFVSYWLEDVYIMISERNPYVVCIRLSSHWLFNSCHLTTVTMLVHINYLNSIVRFVFTIALLAWEWGCRVFCSLWVIKMSSDTSSGRDTGRGVLQIVVTHIRRYWDSLQREWVEWHWNDFRIPSAIFSLSYPIIYNNYRVYSFLIPYAISFLGKMSYSLMRLIQYGMNGYEGGFYSCSLSIVDRSRKNR